MYRILDGAIASGEVVEVERNGRIVRIVPPSPRSWLDKLPRNPDVIVGDPDDLIEIDWSTHWKPDPMLTHCPVARWD